VTVTELELHSASGSQQERTRAGAEDRRGAEAVEGTPADANTLNPLPALPSGGHPGGSAPTGGNRGGGPRARARPAAAIAAAEGHREARLTDVRHRLGVWGGRGRAAVSQTAEGSRRVPGTTRVGPIPVTAGRQQRPLGGEARTRAPNRRSSRNGAAGGHAMETPGQSGRRGRGAAGVMGAEDRGRQGRRRPRAAEEGERPARRSRVQEAQDAGAEGRDGSSAGREAGSCVAGGIEDMTGCGPGGRATE